MNRLEPVETGCPKCGSNLKYLGEVSAEQLEMVACAFPGPIFTRQAPVLPFRRPGVK